MAIKDGWVHRVTVTGIEAMGSRVMCPKDTFVGEMKREELKALFGRPCYA